MKTQEDVAKIMEVVVDEIRNLRKAGQKEYAGGDNALGNFERLATKLQLDHKKVLWVYATKHLDGIESFLNGHISQREDVRGRINDVIVYLVLLRAMIDDENEISELAMSNLQQLANRR